LALTPKWPTAQQVVTVLERSLKARGKQRQKAQPIAWPELPDPNRKPRLSVCMIVKNEERFLGQCLASVKDIADELIVIDTGSTDRTVEIAREYGAHVGHFKWCNDFAAARNASIAPATGDWILFLDADEELAANTQQALHKHFQITQIALFRLPIINSHQGESSRSFVPRLFRNISGITFIGCVHEGVMTTLERIIEPWKLECDFGDSMIVHHGYESSIIRDRDKIQRNHDLLRRAVAESPREFYYHMQLGLELGNMGKKEDSFKEYSIALSLVEGGGCKNVTPEVRETLLTQYSAYLLMDKQYQKVIDVLSGKLASSGALTCSQLMVKARALVELVKPEEALLVLQDARIQRDKKTLFPSAFNPNDGSLETIAGEAMMQNHDYIAAKSNFEIALDKGLINLRVILAYANCLEALGKIAEAIEFLHKATRNWKSLPEIWSHGFMMLSKHKGLEEVAQEWVDEADVNHHGIREWLKSKSYKNKVV
jgi:glycosyltransferase involved in cell wall biosynthesis